MNSSLKMERLRRPTLKLDDIIAKTVRNKGWQKKITEMNAVNSWNKENIGKEVCANSQAYHIEDGKLYVLVSNSTWMNELTFLKPQIIKNINQAVGSDVVKDIQFKIGDVSGYRKSQSETNKWKRKEKDDSSKKIDLEEIELEQETLDKIDEAVLEIDDPELRERFRRVFIMSSKSKMAKLNGKRARGQNG